MTLDYDHWITTDPYDILEHRCDIHNTTCPCIECENEAADRSYDERKGVS